MIDLHSDTIYRLRYGSKGESLLRSSLSVTRDSLLAGGVTGQCFALYVHNEDLPHSPWEELNILHDRFVSEITAAGIPQMRSIREHDGTLKAMLTTEEGASIEGDISRLEILKGWGVMIFGLTWNYENELAYPNSKDRDNMSLGLKKKGFECVEECGRLGIAVDVSHLSDGGFWDVLKVSEKPFIATHSNARAITGASRNLSDDMIRALADKGGVMGLCLHPSFLGPVPSDLSLAVTHVEDMVRHAEHIYRTGGEDVLAIGSDIDGIPGTLEHPYPECFRLLSEELSRRGMPSSVLDKMMEKNAIRVLSDIGLSH